MYFNQILEQKQILSQQQIFSLNVLSMDSYELEKFLLKEEVENPILTVKIAKEKEIVVHNDMADITPTFKYKIKNNLEEANDVMNYISDSSESLKDFLFSQIDLKKINKTFQNLLSYLIELIDTNGYIRFSKKEIAKITNQSLEDINVCFHLLYQLEPVGIGAYDLIECLKIQLKRKNIYDRLFEELLNNHLEDIANGRVKKIAKTLSIEESEVIFRIKEIQALNPKPLNGTCFYHSQNEYLIPDIIFSSIDKKNWSVSLTNQNKPIIGIAKEYEQILEKSQNKEFYNYYQDKKKNILFIRNCIEKRNHTILEISKYILQYQINYFNGESALKALTAKQIADALNIHPSTVSRAIKDKYVQHPMGVQLLKDFLIVPFRKNQISEDKNCISKTKIIETLVKIIKTEDTVHPYSDSILVKKMQERNIKISRRTIAQYRSELGIGNAQKRRTEYNE